MCGKTVNRKNKRCCRAWKKKRGLPSHSCRNKRSYQEFFFFLRLVLVLVVFFMMAGTHSLCCWLLGPASSRSGMSSGLLTPSSTLRTAVNSGNSFSLPSLRKKE